MGTASRAATGSDSVLGRSPRLVFEPGTTAEAAEVFAQAAADKLHLAVIGGGTALGLGRGPDPLDAVVRTSRMARILEYAPADMVLIAEAGVTLAQIQATTRQQRQRLALDAPDPARATVGGLVATGAAGPLRARYGTIRDLIIGVALVRADGKLARGGGKVVKNVAGFDLPKLACGSLGTLGMIAAANFRLHPLPEVSVTALVPGLQAAQVALLQVRAREAQLEPAAATALRGAGGRFDLGVVFEGFAAGVAQQLARLAEVARAAGAGCERLSDQAAADFRARHDQVRETGELRVRVAALPSGLGAVDALSAPLLGALTNGAFAWYAAAGVGWISGAVTEASAAAAALATLRDGLAGKGGSLVLEATPPALRSVDPWGPVPASFPLMQRLKHNFDPERRLNPGRFLGGL